MSTLWHEAMIKASTFYLKNPLSKEVIEGDRDAYDVFLLCNAWEPFEDFSADALQVQIEHLANTFIEVGLRLRGSEVSSMLKYIVRESCNEGDPCFSVYREDKEDPFAQCNTKVQADILCKQLN